MERLGFISSVGNLDFCFVTEFESGQIFFCHHSRVRDGVIPRSGARVLFDALPYERGDRKCPIISLEVLSG